MIARAAGVAILAVLFALLGSCKREQKPLPGKTAAPVAVPKEVTVYVGIRNPARTIDDALALARNLAPIPFDRAGLLDLFAQRAKLPREMLSAIDTGGTFWLLLLDGEQAGERDPTVLVLPLRSRKQFEEGLAKKLQRSGSEGDLVIYKPRPGEVGGETRLLIGEKTVIAPSSKKVLDLTHLFILRNLIERPPLHDVALHVMTENLLKGPGKTLDTQVARALDKVRAAASQPASLPAGKAGSTAELVAQARQTATRTTEDTVKWYLELAKSVREVLVTAEINPKQVTLAVRGEAQSGGLLHQVIKRQRPGPLFAHKLLPASSFLVAGNLSNPEARRESRRTVDGLLAALVKGGGAPEKLRLLERAARTLDQQLTGDLTLALHRPGNGAGVAITLLARVKEAEAARRAIESLATLCVEWYREQVKKAEAEGKREPRLEGEQRPFSHKGARGSLVSIAIPWPEERRDQATRLFGERLGFGWAFLGEHAIFYLGKDAAAQLELLAGSAASGKREAGLHESPSFQRALGASPARVGLLYLSLVDLMWWFEGTGFKDGEAMAAVLKGAKVSSAPSIDWGVNALRTQLDVSLHLPVDHFRAFKPIFDELIKRRSGPASQPAESD
jgi:hypothetical protein